MSASGLDVITLEVMHNGLRAIADEMFIALKKSAYSTNIKEREDHSTCIMDVRGRAIVQADRTQAVHLGSMSGHLRHVLLKYDLSEIHEGDIFVSNDPYAAGGSHLPDMNFAMPIFADGKIIAFACNIAHHADVGGMTPGSMSAEMTSIYQEGIRLPVVRLLDCGRLVEDILDVLLLNARIPEERRGDYFAQIAACRLGERRMRDFVRRHSAPQVAQAFDEIIDRTALRVRAAIKEIPDGIYSFEDVMDDDGHGMRDIPIRLKVTVAGDRIRFDFTGSAPQVTGNINCPPADPTSMVCFVIKAILDPTMPNNQGMIDAIEVVAEEGSLIRPAFPAAVAFRAHTCQRIVDAVLGALAQAVPHLVIAASNGANTMAVFSGIDPRRGGRYLLLETLGGGCGARSYKDGKDGVQQHVSNTSNMPVEAFESEYPILIDRYEFIVDSGGAGQHRGGLGLRRVYRPIGHSALFVGSAERFTHTPWGLFDGAAGAGGRYTIVDDDGTRTPLPSKPKPVPIRPDQRIMVESPGAGGYGAPSSRDPAMLANDFFSEKYSEGYIETHYKMTGRSLEPHWNPDMPDYTERLIRSSRSSEE